MRGILIDPGKLPEIRNVPDTAQGLDAYLGGSVRVKRFSPRPWCIFRGFPAVHCPPASTTASGIMTAF